MFTKNVHEIFTEIYYQSIKYEVVLLFVISSLDLYELKNVSIRRKIQRQLIGWFKLMLIIKRKF